MESKVNWPFRIGLFLVVIAWFSFNFYEFTLGIFSRHTTWPIVTEDIPGVWGLGLVVAGGLIAITTVLHYILKKDPSKTEVITSLRNILLLQAAYFLAFLPGPIWRFYFRFSVSNIVGAILPTLVESVAIPIVLVKLYLELNPNKSMKGAIKWGLISLFVFLFVFWFTNSISWVGAVLQKGADYLLLYPVNMLSFVLTVFGLLALTFYAAWFSKNTIGKEVLGKFDASKIGLLISILGLYYNLIYVLWLFFGSVGGWGRWYAWFLGHGNLWALSLPFVGLPLLFGTPTNCEDVELKFNFGLIKKKWLNSFLYSAQAIGAVFYAVFSAAYILSIPSTKVLTGDPIFHSLLLIFGGLFLILIISALVLFTLVKQSDKPSKSDA
jgi:hypothetical protein